MAKAPPQLAKGLSAQGRSKTYKRRGLWAIKKKNGELAAAAWRLQQAAGPHAAMVAGSGRAKALAELSCKDDGVVRRIECIAACVILLLRAQGREIALLSRAVAYSSEQRNAQQQNSASEPVRALPAAP